MAAMLRYAALLLLVLAPYHTTAITMGGQPGRPQASSSFVGSLPVSRLAHNKYASAFIFPMTPDGLGQYLCTLAIGTPPQYVSGVVDTGSAIMHSPSLGCQADGCDLEGLQKLNLSESSTYEPVACGPPALQRLTASGLVHATQSCTNNCTFFDNQDGDRQMAGQITYTQGTSNSFMFYEDLVGVVGSYGITQRFSVLMGADYAADDGSYSPRLSGVWGANFGGGSLWRQYRSLFSLDPVLTMCLGDGITPVINPESHDGFFAVGAVNLTYPNATAAGGHSSPPRHYVTPMLEDLSLPYQLLVGFTAVYVGNVSVYQVPVGPVGQPPLVCVLDTGTSTFDVPHLVVGALVAHLTRQLLRVKIVVAVENYLDSFSGASGLVVKFREGTPPLSALAKDSLLPWVYFQMSGAGLVPWRPSSYLLPGLYSGGALPRFHEIIWLGDGAADSLPDNYGVMGNAFLNRFVIQADQAAGSITFTPVEHCPDVTVTPARLASVNL